ncbi:MAG TPA: GNAT family N-acetyltransferase, partial [Pirellulales bacterium]|nr:GNAT family N-acetyltransferase [Pirellulales bacterium]
QTRGASYFQSLDWLQAYWRHYGHRQQLRVLVVRAGDEPLGIVPLVLRTERTRLGPLRVLTYPLDHWGVFYGAIGPQAAATLTAACKYLRARRRDWDVLSLRWVHRDAHDHGRTEHAMRFAGLPPCEEIGERAASIDLTGAWQQYWASRGSHWRNNVGRCERKLAEQGGATYSRYRPQGAAFGDADPRWDLFETCVELAGRSWQGAATDGTTLSHEAVRDYLRDAHAAAAHAGGVDLNLLYLGDRPAAFAYNYYYRGHVFGLRMGYDPSVCSAGAGTVLMRRMIADSFERGDHMFELGPGSLAAKRPWQTSLETSYRYSHFAAAPRAQAMRLRRYMKNWLDSGALTSR